MTHRPRRWALMATWLAALAAEAAWPPAADIWLKETTV